MATSLKQLIVIALCTLGLMPTTAASDATYRMTVVNEWTEDQFPAAYPDNAHWAMLGGGTHSPDQSFWQLGALASSQIETMAEGGNVTSLRSQIISGGGSGLLWNYWWCYEGNPSGACGSTAVEFTLDSERSAVTLTSMIAPSPDWFIGTQGLNLYINDAWINTLTIPLAMYDAGTEQGAIPSGSNPPSSPVEPISYITYNNANGLYELSSTPQFVGTMTFELLSVAGDFDGDGDTVTDSFDNCTRVANANQKDTDADGFGNACDVDTNNDCVVNFLDIAQFADAFLGSDELFDFNDDGVVNFLDFNLVSQYFLGAPGPSALAMCN